MRSIRESSLFNKNRRLTERKSIVGAFSAFGADIFRDKFWYPHEEMSECIKMYNQNSFTQSAVNTMKEFIKGGDIIVKSKDEPSMKKAQAYIDSLDVDTWVDEIIENCIKTGNAYLEIDYKDSAWKEPWKCYAIADSSRIYINCDEFGLPKKEKRRIVNPYTAEVEQVEMRNDEEFYVQRIDVGFRHPKAKWYDMSYHVGFQFKKFRIYGIPINKRKMIHFKLNVGDTGIYGRSQLAATLDDYETLKQLERSIAIIAKYKAVPRDIIMYGDKDNPATDDELDEFVIYLESLEKEESAIVNKPIKRESLAYAGQDINLDYMIKHIKQKLIAGIAPDFMMGVGDQITKSSAQITLISYILAIYSKRKIFLKPIEKFFLKPFVKKEKLKNCWLEFGELDFETKSEKVNRVGSLWVQNLLTFNEAREELGKPVIGKEGDVYYLEWQSDMMVDLGEEFPGYQQNELPNGEPLDKVHDHNPAPNRKPQQDGGKMPFDPYQKPTNVPKFLPKKDLGKPESYDSKIMTFFENSIPNGKSYIESDKLDPIPSNYDLDSNSDFALKENFEKEVSYDTLMDDFYSIFKEPRITEIYYKEVENGWIVSFMKSGVMIYCKVTKDDILSKAGDISKMTSEEKEGIVNDWKNRYLRKAIHEEFTEGTKKKTSSESNKVQKKISFDTLIGDFYSMFDEPRVTEIYYKVMVNGWRLSFVKNNILIYCDVTYNDILSTFGRKGGMTEDEKKGIIMQWQNRYLRKAIKEV